MEEISLAHTHKEFVAGYISHSPLRLPVGGEEMDMLTFTTGVNRSSAGNGRLRKYRTPKETVAGGGDVIVGSRLYENPEIRPGRRGYSD